jgi:glycosyltransferase involved in cell wall biosynthesis
MPILPTARSGSEMAIIHLLTPEYAPKVGGVADYTRVVARGLADEGEDVHVWCSSDGKGSAGDRFTVHPDLGQFRGADLARAGKCLDAFPRPRRVIVQWVPHAYGFRAMNLGFCLWLWTRASRGDEIELMVHEPYLAFWEGSWRQTAAAMVHRLMTVVLLQSARRVWVAIPAWESKWKPYTLGRVLPFTWLPIPSGLSPPDANVVGTLRTQFGTQSRALVGHLGTYGSLVAPLLMGVLAAILRQPHPPRVLLIGAGSLQFRTSLLARYPQYTDSVYSTGPLDEVQLAAHVAACDLLVQPYLDGISSRRTSAMAALSLGVPVVTTRGRLTESLWADSEAVRLTAVNDAKGMAGQVEELLRCPEATRRLGEAGRALYLRTFDVSRTIGALKNAPRRAA